jgi:hypothetical protein
MVFEGINSAHCGQNERRRGLRLLLWQLSRRAAAAETADMAWR